LKDWDFQHPIIPTDFLSVEDVGRLGAWCMREYYSKPERIHRIMESDYDMRVKLCVKDFMTILLSGKPIPRAGRESVVMVSIQTSMNWTR